jgi:hypothetical protein
MRTFAWLFVGLLGIGGVAEAQTSARTVAQQWDIGASVGLFQAAPEESTEEYGDDWYFEGRYALSLGRYWTKHLKTEFELATTGEGSRYSHRYALTVPGVPPYYPYPVDEYYRLHQASGRVVWQFFENAWVHPYVFGGVSLDIERQRARIPEHYFYSGGDARTPANRILVAPARQVGPETDYRAGVVFGAGTKIYITPRAYFNPAIVASYAKPTRTVSLIAGFGWDF